MAKKISKQRLSSEKFHSPTRQGRDASHEKKPREYFSNAVDVLVKKSSESLLWNDFNAVLIDVGTRWWRRMRFIVRQLCLMQSLSLRFFDVYFQHSPFFGEG